MKIVKIENEQAMRHMLQRYRGALAGLVAADMMEMRLEGASMETIKLVPARGKDSSSRPLSFGSEATAMAMCLCESLEEVRGFDPVDQLERYRRFYREGSMGHLPGMRAGAATRDAVECFERTHEPYPGDKFPCAEGIGPLVRVAPVAMAFRQDPRLAIEHAAESARATHGSREVIDATRYLAALLVGALNGVDTSELTGEELFEPVAGIWDAEPLSPGVTQIPRNLNLMEGEQAEPQHDDATKTLEAVLRALSSTRTFESAVIAAIDAGEGANTPGVVCGQLAGAFYGYNAIPESWISPIWQYVTEDHASTLIFL